jgi:hypothetical protein
MRANLCVHVDDSLFVGKPEAARQLTRDRDVEYVMVYTEEEQRTFPHWIERHNHEVTQNSNVTEAMQRRH